MEHNSYERYAKIRDLRGLTDYKVTKLAGIKGTATISNWKNGKYTPKDDKMQSIATVLEVTIDFLMGKTDMVVCPVCGFGNNPLSEKSNEEHAKFHKQFTIKKDKFNDLMTSSDAARMREDSLRIIRNPNVDIQEKIYAFDNYLTAEYSLLLLSMDNIDGLNYDDFCKSEVLKLHSDYSISSDLINILLEAYNVSIEFVDENASLLARASDNHRLMRLLAYAEKLSSEELNVIENTMKSIIEQKG